MAKLQFSFFFNPLFIAFTKPYKKAYMNFLDTILLANLSVLSLLLSSVYFKTQAIKVFILLLLMMASVTFFVFAKMMHDKILKKVSFKQKMILLYRFCRAPEQAATSSTCASLHDVNTALLGRQEC